MNDKTIQRLKSAIWDEIGGYEATHPAMWGAADAVVSRVLAVLEPTKEGKITNEETNLCAENERLRRACEYAHSQSGAWLRLGADSEALRQIHNTTGAALAPTPAKE